MVSVVLRLVKYQILSPCAFAQMYKYVTVTPRDKRRKLEDKAVMENAQNSAVAAAEGNKKSADKEHGVPDVDSGQSGGTKTGKSTKDGVVEQSHVEESQVADKSVTAQDEPQQFKFDEKEGDLFSCPPSWSLAHCISVDAHMGKGIAVLFRDKFKGVDEIKKQGAKVGGCAILERDSRYIYYLTTKERYFEKPTYDSLQSSLETMKKHCIEKEVKNVAMPAIGCGLDKLEWPKVKEMLREVFGDTSLAITVYMLGKDASKSSKGSSSRGHGPASRGHRPSSRGQGPSSRRPRTGNRWH